MYNNVNAPLTMGANMPYQPVNAAPVMAANVPYQPEYTVPAYGYGCYTPRGCDTFVLIVVLFILLIIVGACTFCGYKD